jgi:CO dehydrogenase nickel-insertion accessory protein CooC1
MEVVGSIAFSHGVMEADMKGSSPHLYSRETVEEVKAIKEKIEKSFQISK